MKIRNGFVSNSSSSSFLMVGLKIDTPEDIVGFFGKLENLSVEEIKQKAKTHYDYNDDEDISDDNLYDYCMENLYEFDYEEDGFDIFLPEDADFLIIGRQVGYTYNQEVTEVDVDSLGEESSERFEVVLERLGLDREDAKIFLGGL